MIDAVYFFTRIKEVKLFNSLTQQQVDTINAVLSEIQAQGLTDLRQVAYVFATGYWEANNPKKLSLRFTPMTEFGSTAYLQSKPYYPYIGRGLSQLTWKSNYKKEGERLHLDLLNNPDLMLEIPTAANSHVYNMRVGGYTGKKLSSYINETKCDYFNARRIINGTDQAATIASIAQKFEQCLKNIP